jgi:hypothetical protein
MKKVTAKNLMIGDWVRYNKEYRKVLALFVSGKGECKMSFHYCYNIKSATPIPITEEWLKGNGFEDKGYSLDTQLFLSIGMADIYYTVKINYAQIHTLDGVYMLPNIQYIHQLQQAYRLATGKELKVKF